VIKVAITNIPTIRKKCEMQVLLIFKLICSYLITKVRDAAVPYPKRSPSDSHLRIITSFHFEIFTHCMLINSIPVISVEAVMIAERREVNVTNVHQKKNKKSTAERE